MGTIPPTFDGSLANNSESFATNVLANLIANLMTTGLLQLGKLIGFGQIDNQNLTSNLEKEWDLRSTLQIAAVQMGRALEIANEDEANKIKIFLTTPEVEVMLRQVFACHLLATDVCPGLDEVSRLFGASFSLHTGIDNPTLEQAIWSSLVNATEIAIKLMPLK
jgi:hypothetical protein